MPWFKNMNKAEKVWTYLLDNPAQTSMAVAQALGMKNNSTAAMLSMLYRAGSVTKVLSSQRSQGPVPTKLYVWTAVKSNPFTDVWKVGSLPAPQKTPRLSVADMSMAEAMALYAELKTIFK